MLGRREGEREREREREREERGGRKGERAEGGMECETKGGSGEGITKRGRVW